MATWGLHIRIAEQLLSYELNLDKESFLIGNIGPDCGIRNKDKKTFNPPVEITHWSERGKENIDAEKFSDAYLKKKIEDKKEKSFLLGYYAHLLTDIEFSKFFKEKREKDKNYERLKEDEKFIWTIKKDWNDLNRLYFRDNPNSVFYEIFQHVKEFPDYLDYYPKGAIIQRVKFIIEYYTKSSNDLDREYIYSSQKEMEDFIERVGEKIKRQLEAKLV